MLRWFYDLTLFWVFLQLKYVMLCRKPTSFPWSFYFSLFCASFFSHKDFFVVLFSHTLTGFFWDFPFSFIDTKYFSESIFWNWKIFISLENALWEKRFQSVRLQIHDQTQYEYLMFKSYEIRWIISTHKQNHLWQWRNSCNFYILYHHSNLLKRLEYWIPTAQRKTRWQQKENSAWK